MDNRVEFWIEKSRLQQNEIESLKEENDRFRHALELIAEVDAPNDVVLPDCWAEFSAQDLAEVCAFDREIARNALGIR